MIKRFFFFLLKIYASDQGNRIQICKVLQDGVRSEFYEDCSIQNFATAAGEMMKANPMYRCEGKDRDEIKYELSKELDWINDYKIKN